MGRHPYLWIRKQYCYNANTSPIDLQIQLTPIKIPADFFEKSDILKIHTEKQRWRTQTSQFQSLLQSYSNQNSVVPAQK